MFRNSIHQILSLSLSFSPSLPLPPSLSTLTFYLPISMYFSPSSAPTLSNLVSFFYKYSD